MSQAPYPIAAAARAAAAPISAASITSARPYASDQSLADQFDAPHIEPVRMPKDPADPRSPRVVVDIPFARLDMDYWAQWANSLREKRAKGARLHLDRQHGIDPISRNRILAEIDRRDVQIFEVLDQQYAPDGIKKILDDALRLAGMNDGNERKRVLKCIGPMRQQQIASEVCSEPRASIDQLRDAIKQLATKLGKRAEEIAAMNDDQLIAFASTYQAPPPAATLPGAGGSDEAEDTSINPTAPGAAEPEPGSISDQPTPQSEPSSGSIPGA